MSGHEFIQSKRLNGAAYDVRNPKMRELSNQIQMEIETHTEKMLKMDYSSKQIKQFLIENGLYLHCWHIGNPPAFGIEMPEEIIDKIKIKEKNHRDKTNKRHTGYTDSSGIPEAIESIYQYCQNFQGLKPENIFGTDGVSEGIKICCSAICDPGNEILLPTPNYPLWRLQVQLSDGKPVHYNCDEQSNWYPDIADIKRKINDRTKAIVIINPNNPTGSVYPKEILLKIIQLARENNLIILADECYSEILYDGAVHIPIATLADDVLIFTLNGLSKNRLIPGIRSGWMVISGCTQRSTNLINGVCTVTNSRLNPNLFGQVAIPVTLHNSDFIQEYIKPGGRLHEQIKFTHQRVNQIPGLSCVKPQSGLYVYAQINPKLPIYNDEQFIFDLLKEQRIQLVQGTGFDDRNKPLHIRITCLAEVEEMANGLNRIEQFLQSYKQ